MSDDREPQPEESQSGIGAWLARIPAGRRSKWVVIAVWIAILAVVSPFAAQLSDVETSDNSEFLPANAESLEVDELLEAFENGETIPAVLVYERQDGLTESDLEAAEADRQSLAEIVPENGIDDVVVSPSGEAALINVDVSGDSELLEEQIEDVRAIVQGGDGPNVYVSGQAGFSYDATQVFDGINSTLLIASAIVVTVLLLVIYRSPFVWIVPLLVVGFAYQSATATIYGMVSQLGITASAQNNGILAILIFGVGTDYALLLIARYREELRKYDDDHIAMASALRNAGPAVLASGGTAIIGLLCLLLADLNSTRGLGPIGAAGIFSAFVAMLTLLPAILVVVGRRIFWPFIPRWGEFVQEGEGLWHRIGRMVSGRPRPIWVGGTIALVLMIGGMLTLGDDLTQEESFIDDPESLVGQRVIAQHFSAGSSQPTIIIADAEYTEEVLGTVDETDGVDEAFPLGESGDLISFGAILEAEPESDGALRTIERLRENVGEVSGAGALVGGPDAEELDTLNTNERDRLVVIPVVLSVVFVILVILLRGLIAPLLMVGTTIISFHAALGVVGVLFTWGLGYSGIPDYVVLLAFVFLITLGIDYNIFLMTRIREESAKHDTTEATIRGLSASGGVITSAGIVLAATFLVLGVLPLVELLQLGVIVAFGVLLETTIVRSIILPALAIDLGERIWWPGTSLKAQRHAASQDD